MKHHVMLTGVRRRVRGRFHLAGERAGGRESIGRSQSSSMRRHQLGRRPAIPARWAQFALLEATAEAVPLTLRLKFPPN